MQETDIKRFKEVLSQCDATIIYNPIEDEINLNKLALFDAIPNTKKVLSNDKNSDPFVLAEQFKNEYSDCAVCIFIPGKKFDLNGTRHGRGGGWYDRFLSRVPATWVRVGVAGADKISETPLTRAPWDEPVDWLLIADGEVLTMHETSAEKTPPTPSFQRGA